MREIKPPELYTYVGNLLVIDGKLWQDSENKMSVMESTEEQEMRETKYPKLRVLTGGKGPPDPPDGPSHNWLAEYEVGTTFVARHRNSKEVDLNLYHVLFKSLPEVVLLKWQLPDGKLLDYYVDPARFSKQFESPTILGVITEAAEADGGEDGNSHRTDRPADMVLHEAVPGEHQLSQDPQ